MQNKFKKKEDNTSRALELSVAIDSTERELQALNNDINVSQMELNDMQIAITTFGHYIIKMENALFNMHEEVWDYAQHVKTIDNYMTYQ